MIHFFLLQVLQTGGGRTGKTSRTIHSLQALTILIMEEFILAHSVTFARQMMDVFRHDAGTYTCLATNTIGESMGKDVDIDVQCE